MLLKPHHMVSASGCTSDSFDATPPVIRSSGEAYPLRNVVGHQPLHVLKLMLHLRGGEEVKGSVEELFRRHENRLQLLCMWGRSCLLSITLTGSSCHWSHYSIISTCRLSDHEDVWGLVNHDWAFVPTHLCQVVVHGQEKSSLSNKA